MFNKCWLLILRSLFLPPAKGLIWSVGFQGTGWVVSWLAGYLYTKVLQVTGCDWPCSKKPGCLLFFAGSEPGLSFILFLSLVLCTGIWTQGPGPNVVTYFQRSLSSVILLPVWASHSPMEKWSLFLCPPWVWASLWLLWFTEHEGDDAMPVSNQVLRRAGSFHSLPLQTLGGICGSALRLPHCQKPMPHGKHQ